RNQPGRRRVRAARAPRPRSESSGRSTLARAVRFRGPGDRVDASRAMPDILESDSARLAASTAEARAPCMPLGARPGFGSIAPVLRIVRGTVTERSFDETQSRMRVRGRLRAE